MPATGLRGCVRRESLGGPGRDDEGEVGGRPDIRAGEAHQEVDVRGPATDAPLRGSARDDHLIAGPPSASGRGARQRLPSRGPRGSRLLTREAGGAAAASPAGAIARVSRGRPLPRAGRAPPAPSRATPAARARCGRASRSLGLGATAGGGPCAASAREVRVARRELDGRATCASTCRGSSAEQRLRERVGVEVEQVVDLLAHAHEQDRHTDGALDGEGDAALGRRVELGQRDRR